MGLAAHELSSGHVAGWRGEGFDALYRAYFPRLVMFVRSRLHDQALAEDIAQEALVRAYSRIDELDSSRAPWGWLRTVALNLCVDHIRRRSHEVLSDVDDGDASTSLSPEETDLLERALNELPTRQRVAMSLRYLDDWDNAQVASFLGLTKTGFEQLLYRARRKLHFHYNRLSQEIFGLVLLPITASRSLLKRLRTATSAGESLGQIAVSAHQIAHVVVAAVVAFGTLPATDVSRSDVVPGRAPAIASSTDARKDTSDQRLPAVGSVATSGATDGRSDEAAARSGPGANGGAVVETPEGVKRVQKGLDPNKDVREPEDGHILSLAPSPNFAEDRTIFATGTACGLPSCTRVLFRSRDGGTTWTRLPSENLLGDTIGIPAGFGTADRRIFAMGPSGLQVSEDGGKTFATAALSGAPYAVGSMAISPAFTSGDPSILIGSQSLMHYDDVRRVITPAPYTSLPGPLEPAYSPSYPADPRIIIGAMKPSGPGFASVLYRCTDVVCEETIVGPYGAVPKVRLAPDFGSSNVASAFLADKLFLSRDGARSFLEVSLPNDSTYISDVAVGHSGRQVVLATHPKHREGPAGIFVTRDFGRSWTKLRSPLLARGADNIVMTGSTIVVGLAKRGVACSTDNGHTWGRRCR